MAGTHIKNREAEVVIFRRRALLAGLLILLAFMVLVARLTWLQVVKRDYYHTLAEANRISLVPVVPNRGLILDRNGKLLAENHPSFSLNIIREQTRKAGLIFIGKATAPLEDRPRPDVDQLVTAWSG